MMRIASFYILLLSFFMSSCSNKATYQIETSLKNASDSVIYIVYEGDNNKFIDTVFSEKPGVFKSYQERYGYHSATLFLSNRTPLLSVFLEEKKAIKISGDINYPILCKVSGGSINNKRTEWLQKMRTLLKEEIDLQRKIDTSEIEQNESLRSDLVSLRFQIIEKVTKLIQNNPREKASVTMINDFFTKESDTRRIDEMLAVLDPQLKSFYLVRELEKYSLRAKRTELGEEAPDFRLRNIYGEYCSLGTFKDKYLLLIFTAPWCDLCQVGKLDLDEIFSTNKVKDLKVLLVGLDSDADKVREKFKNDTIKWNYVVDSLGQTSALLDLYNVKVLPQIFLIDKEKKIILKAENGFEVKKTLNDIFENKQ